MVGTFVPPTPFKRSRGFVGYNFETFSRNFVPQWRHEHFFSVFSVYFPAATGIMAGANISGDLKDPSKAIPKGTLLAIFLTTIIYMIALWMVASSCERDASGVIDEFGQ
uniref:Amino acid permease/ SLC12A domain-containing protein n=1 Tax=Romanomermis culicivorax TaxID=13658 RepID=A0A915IN06_ROMCU